MRKFIIIGGLAAALALPLTAVSTSAEAASCSSRKATGTVLGGVGGALLGNSISKGGGGAIIGGVGGAVLGREVGKSGCKKRYTRTASYRAAPAREAYRAPAQRVYYDQYGNRISR